MKRLSFKIFYYLIIAALGLQGCQKKESPGFVAMPPEHTGIHFENKLTETEYFNIIEYLYFYNGGGVAVGDINNDGLDDIFFTANQLQNKLYLNKGDLVFEDITNRSGVAGVGNWKTGVTMADVNGDGHLDIFVCGVGNYKFFNGKNQLLINNGDLTFSDMTEAYGLHFQGFSTHAAFFDYDLDGDLDMYLLNHSVHSTRSHGNAQLRHESDSLAGDRLYRNDLVPYGRPRFTDVTTAAGIFNSPIGYGLGIGVSDLNVDGYPDLYVSNDFHENDYLYMNQGDGSFREVSGLSLSHASRFSMGNDIADINNDGLPDIISLDMLPKEEDIIKTTAGEDPYEIYNYKLSFGYHHQFARNALQLNRGKGLQGNVLFSDIAAFARVEASDWSWSALLADFDNNGYKDLFVGNGIVTRPNDLDYINFISTDSAQRYYAYASFIRNMPSGSVPNFFFRNNGNLAFEDVSAKWTGTQPTISTGAAYSDLDRDGDLDLVVNNVGDVATVYRNDLSARPQNWLQFTLRGEGANPFGVGTKIIVYSAGKVFHQEQFPSRGFQSSVTPVVHVGLGDESSVDSVRIIWPDGLTQLLTDVSPNKRMTLLQEDAVAQWNYHQSERADTPLLSRKPWDRFTHRENAFNAFAAEKLMPHMLSTQGPKVASGDMNADGLEDFFVGGAAGQSAAVFLQTKNGEFQLSKQPALLQDSAYEDTGAVCVDVDGNHTMDLVVVSGGQQFSGDHALLRPRIYINDGSGRLEASKQKGLRMASDASCVSSSDFDNDGDADLFIGGRVIAGRYGAIPRSHLFVNDGQGNFADESHRLPVDNGELGLVTDAIWNDLNSDGRSDLIIVGEWMPITILIQDLAGQFRDKTAAYGLAGTEGWWNAIHATDIDGDNDLDFLVGNLGLNSRLRANKQEPVSLYAGDIDENGGMDHLLTYYNGGKSHPFISRDQLVKQVPSFRRAFLKYDNFRYVKLENIIPEEEAARFRLHHAYDFASAVVVNDDGTFRKLNLPAEAQMFPIFAFETGDFNHDNITDVLAVGNFYSVQPEFGRYDAGYGLMLLGEGEGVFKPLPPSESGFVVRGEGRDVQKIESTGGTATYVVGRNNDMLLLFQ